jgi:hypothetical protein
MVLDACKAAVGCPLPQTNAKELPNIENMALTSIPPTYLGSDELAITYNLIIRDCH